MDPTTAIPVHFTLQALSIAAAGLLLAWSLVRRRWVGALGAALLAIGEGLHAGRFLATDDEPALLVVRFAGVLFLSVAAVRAPGRLLYASGAGAVVAGAAWGSVAGGGISNPTIGPHGCFAVGSILLAVWAWSVSRDSVRLRVLTALVAMLAITVVMGGGAVSRVAAIDKRNEQLRQLGSAATAASSDIGQSVTGLARRATLLSPLLADDLDKPGEPAAVRTSEPGEAESIAVIDRQGVRAFESGRGNTPPAYGPEKVRASPAVQRALDGRAATAVDVSGGRLAILAAAPIFRPGAPATVIGAVAIVRTSSPEALREAARTYAPEAEIVVVGDAAAASERFLLGVQPATLEGDDVVFERVSTPADTRPAATIGIGGGVRMVVVGSDEGVVQGATGLLRALLVAILAAALLAVIVALWLSARVTRPILDLAAGAEQIKADFLASVSHELRTPLTPIRGYTELLRRGRVPAGRRADYLDEIGEAAGRLERIVSLLLDVAALEAGRFQIGDDDVDPSELLDDAVERWRIRAPRHPFSVVAGESLPRVRGDADALGRVLDELIDNAVKFSPDGGAVELRAVVESKEGVEISVADVGIGISEEQAGELTGAFAQVESGDRRRFGGLGLGLTYVSGVLAAHGTGLAFATQETGTTFSFTLPAAGSVSRMPARAARSSSSQRKTSS